MYIIAGLGNPGREYENTRHNIGFRVIDAVAERYGIDESKKDVEILSDVAMNRKCLGKGGEVDYSKAAALMIDDFRSGRLGRITLENGT